jgi:hypothetical protein
MPAFLAQVARLELRSWDYELSQGSLTEGEGSVQLTSFYLTVLISSF